MDSTPGTTTSSRLRVTLTIRLIHIRDFTDTGAVPKDPIGLDDLRSTGYKIAEVERKAPGTRFRWIHIPVNDTCAVLVLQSHNPVIAS